jgi:pilus assembly protein FimV
MIVHCEGCESRFHVDEHRIKPTGSKVRCSKCRHEFMAYPPAPADEEEETLILGEALPADKTAAGPAEISDIDFKLDEVFGEAAGEGLELLDVEDLLADAPPPKEEFKASGIGGELDIDLTPTVAADAGDTFPGLDELEIDLSMLEGTAETAAAAPEKGAAQAELELDLDLESLTLEVAEAGGAADTVVGLKHASEAAREAAVQSGASSSAMLDDLSFDLDMADAKTTTLPKDTGVSATSSDTDEIDISDLEDMLDGQGPALAAPPPASATEAGGDLDLDLDLEPKVVAPVKDPQTTDTLDFSMFAEDLKAIGAPESASRGDDLDLPLDLDPETGPTQAEAAVEADELDFSDISAMLEQEEKPVAEAVGESLEDVDLVIEDTPATAGSDEDFLLDLETLLDEGQGTVSAGKPDKVSEDLDLDIVPAAARGSSTDLKIEFEPETGESPLKRPPVAAAARGTMAATDNFSTDEFTSVGASGATSVLEPMPVAEPAAKKKPAAANPRRAGSRKLLLALLGVVALSVAALTLPRSLGINIPFLSDLQIPSLSEMGIEIPSIDDVFGDFFKSEPEDSAGMLKLALVPEGISAEFIANPSAGMLCVVKGQVRNSYNHPRSGMQVTAKLYAAGNAVVKTATVFAGNVLSNQELSSMDLIAISARLKNRSGANNMNVGVKPGRPVPFMAVFSNLPAGVDEYSVEVAGSTP